jgi:hypothetical protein
MAKLKGLGDLLLHELGLAMLPLGFTTRRSSRSFVQKRSYGNASLHLAFIYHQPFDLDVVADANIRIDGVEHAIERSRTENRGRDAATIGAELGNIAGTGQIRWTIASESDVPVATTGIVSAFKSIGLPFIEKYSDLDRLFEVLVDDKDEACLIMPLPHVRYKITLALAEVLNKRDLVASIAAHADSSLSADWERNEVWAVLRTLKTT